MPHGTEPAYPPAGRAFLTNLDRAWINPFLVQNKRQFFKIHEVDGKMDYLTEIRLLGRNANPYLSIDGN